MQKTHHENSPDKLTPTRPLRHCLLSSKKDRESTCAKDWLPPILENIVNILPNYTPLKKQPQFLLSPSPIKKDLFSQLLGSQRKHASPYFSHFITGQNNQMIMEEEDYNDDQLSRPQEEDSLDFDEEQFSETENDEHGSNGCWDDNGVRKRKRKSTAQIRILKQQLDGEMNWTKEKIIKMAEVTGLSQSQVYKWCWDQKKKNIHNKDRKRKIIRKDLNSRGQKPQPISTKFQFDDDGSIKEKQAMEEQLRTKLKSMAMLEEAQTEKKINKKLVFY